MQAQTWQRTWLHDPGMPEAEALLARLAVAPPGPAALLLVAASEAEWGQRAARVWAHGGFTVLLVLRPPPSQSPRTASEKTLPSPSVERPADELTRWASRLRAHPWARSDDPPLWIVTRETWPEVAALALAGKLDACDVVALDGPPRLSPKTPAGAAGETKPSLQILPRPDSAPIPGRWWGPAWRGEPEADGSKLAALRALGWTHHTFPAGSPDEDFDYNARLGRARIAADTLRAAAAPGMPVVRLPPEPALEALPTLHLTLRRLFALGCAGALGLALWVAWRGWRAAPPGLARHSLAWLGGGLWLLAAGLTATRGLGPAGKQAAAAENWRGFAWCGGVGGVDVERAEVDGLGETVAAGGDEHGSLAGEFASGAKFAQGVSSAGERCPRTRFDCVVALRFDVKSKHSVIDGGHRRLKRA